MTTIRVAIVLAASALLLTPACLADVDEDTDEAVEAVRPGPPSDRPGHGNMVNMVPSACSDACEMVANGNCEHWRDDCGDDTPDEDTVIVCGTAMLKCSDAIEAASGDATGLMYCYRECEGMH